MRAKTMMGICGALIAMAIGESSVWAAKAAKQPAAPEAELNAAGQKLLARYSDQLKALQAEIEKALPKVDQQQKAAFLKAYQEEASAIAAELKTMQAQDKAKDKEAAAKAHGAAKEALALAAKNSQAPAKAVLTDLEKFLASDKLDTQLVKYVVLGGATPRGLAEFAQQGPEQEALVEALLADAALMKQMVIADGASGGKYGQAMKIYTDIQKASAKAKNGVLQRLALAISLEHAVPIGQSNPQAQTTAPAIVDPVKRYQHFEKAFLDGELDPAFKDLTVWEYRNAVNGDEPAEALAWGRQMLRNYRPDHIYNPDYGWRYSGAVRTDVKYGSQDVKNDKPSLQNYQNIILNGGVCGRRAFFGRFILRSFGIPTTARPQVGHAALVHWTPQGWVVNLGAGFGCAEAKGILGLTDADFLVETQVRKYPADHIRALRAQWVGDALGEEKYNGHKKGSGGLWNIMALFAKKAIVADAKPRQLAALGTKLGEANESAETKAQAVVKTAVADADKKVAVDSKGVITIPAAACSGSVQPMKSFLGGLQLLCGGGAFHCDLDVPRAGKYALTARVVTVHEGRSLQLTANNARNPVDMAIPYTCGLWQTTKPVEVSLGQGKNVLNFSKPTGNVTIKDFTLTPVK